jgi:tripartite-type tricarboxylate transporter receptor subunit TctC
MTGTDIVHVPYKGTAPAMIDVTGGHVSIILDSTVSSLPNVRAGRLRALAITGRTRASAAPDIPTVAELGVPGYEAVSWYGLLGPAGLPRDIVGALHAQAVKTAASPEVRAKLAALGADPGGNSPEEFSQLIRDEIAKWSKVAATAGIRIE